MNFTSSESSNSDSFDVDKYKSDYESSANHNHKSIINDPLMHDTSQFNKESDIRLRSKFPNERHQSYKDQPISISFAQHPSFLCPDKRAILRDRFKHAKERIQSEQTIYLNKIKIAINNDDIDEIENLMLDKEKQTFYKRQLENCTFLKEMLIQGRIKMLLKVIDNNDFFKFDKTYVFEYLCSKLKEKKKLEMETEHIIKFINNVVENNLYLESLTKVLGWFIIAFGLKKAFTTLVQNNSQIYAIERMSYNQFETEDDINDYFEEPENYCCVLRLCLQEKLEQLAIELIIYRGQLNNCDVIRTAVINNSKIFLKYIWEATNIKGAQLQKKNKTKKTDHNTIMSNYNQTNNEKKKRHMTIFESSLKNTLFNQGNHAFTMTELVNLIYELGTTDLIHEIVSSWKFLDQDKYLLQELFKKQAYDEISILLFRYPNNLDWKFTQANFGDIIINHGLELIQFCLQNQECRKKLEDKTIQGIIISEYIYSGELIYYGAEMLSHIKKTSLDLSLANELLDGIYLTYKKKKISNCYSPVLTCLLLCEIVANIGEISVHFYTRCEKIRDQLMTFCKNIHEANPNEKYIKFLLGQKDSKGRSAYQIAAETEAYKVLESPEVGTIVNKMWVGRLRHDGILAYSSLKKFIEAPTVKGNNPYKAFQYFDQTKTFFHQLCLWEESCSLRFYPESISTVLLIVLYNLFIFFLVNDDHVMVPFSNLSNSMQMMLFGYIVWVCCIVLNIPLQILYCNLSRKRKYTVDFWGLMEICLFISSFMILIDTQLIFPSHDGQGDVIPSDGKSDAAFVLRATILSINDILVWLRITGILLTYKELGPLIRMIYLLSIVTAKYLIIYLILMICAATIYTTLFFKASPMYETYSITFTTLFQGYLNNSDVFDFKYYNMFGAICCIAFVTVGGLILVNMLIALLSNEYTRLSSVVDAAHRSVLITYFKRYKWDKNYGYLILLTTPLNIINFFVIPINMLFKEKKKAILVNSSEEVIEHNDLLKIQTTKQQIFNKIVSRIYFTVFYFPVILIMECVMSIFLIPIAYIVGIFSTLSDLNSRREKGCCHQMIIMVLWIAGGLPFSIYMLFMDIFELFSTIYISVDVNAYDFQKKRIKEFIHPDDIRNFLQFIHKREKNDQNDLHSLFIDYLDFDNEKKAETDIDFKNQNNYYVKLRNAGKMTTKKISFSLSSIYAKKGIQYNKKKEEEDTRLSGRTNKRNLIIIEILENFLIDDGSENFIVDIEKMKLLLPKTMNINNSYIKRLVHTDIASLNKAVNKGKNKENAFLQHKLLNKIVGSIIRLDKVIDAENNSDPLQFEAARKQNNFDIDENEDDFYTSLDEILKKIGTDMIDNINMTDLKIQEEELKIKTKQNKEDNRFLNVN